MEEVRLRLVHPDNMKGERTGAAFRGLERLKSFGVLCEQGDASGQMWDVKAWSRIKEIIKSRIPPVIGQYHLEEGLIDLIVDTEVIGVGITDQPVFICGERSRDQVLAVNAGRVGAIVSLAGFEDPAPAGAPYRSATSEGVAYKAIEAAVMHAAGRIFLPRSDRLYRGYCGTPACIMQECRSAIDLMERISRERLDFCRFCETDIHRTISSMQFPYY